MSCLKKITVHNVKWKKPYYIQDFQAKFGKDIKSFNDQVLNIVLSSSEKEKYIYRVESLMDENYYIK